ncbi:hypothetical protein KEM60_00782 [Austwickia sp. TVS 96-490-7B]|uniref:hypothetical protein n=1 Tax=Austwickia sp. TVS 96-490-7B TaxID=2830843 RepID=UPI001C55FE6F|nr:hypothetical protein [Austwickia sp. TVS 96-490-7B]MBW3084594.1 hypothetical protein [Austwickia sp. TVS 96-490-7B]
MMRACRRRGERSVFVAMMIWGSVASAVLLVVVGAVGVAMGDEESALSGAVGVLVATAFFALGASCLQMLLQHVATPTMMAGAFLVYGLQISALFWLYELVASASWLRGSWLAWGAFGATIAWQASQVWAVTQTRQLIYDGGMPAAVTAEGVSS